jgi:hypothetical protein
MMSSSLTLALIKAPKRHQKKGLREEEEKKKGKEGKKGEKGEEGEEGEEEAATAPQSTRSRPSATSSTVSVGSRTSAALARRAQLVRRRKKWCHIRKRVGFRCVQYVTVVKNGLDRIVSTHISVIKHC